MPIYNGTQKIAPLGIQSAYVGSNKVFEKKSGPTLTTLISSAGSTDKFFRSCCAYVSGDIYIFGGYNFTQQIYKININGTVTSSNSSLKRSVCDGSALYITGQHSLIDNKIYLPSTTGSANYIQIYDIATDTCYDSNYTEYDSSAYGMAARIYGSGTSTQLLYYGGGSNDTASTSNLKNRAYSVNIISGGISNYNNAIVTARKFMAYATVNGTLYMFGGYGGQGQNPFGPTNVSNLSQIISVIGTNGSTTKTAVLPAACRLACAAALGTDIYIFGGYSTASLDTILKYDTLTDTIETLSIKLPQGRHGMCACSNGIDTIYLIGGKDDNNNLYDDVLEFKLPSA